ncbi:S8 family serine peptidase [Mesorhizobium sp.]|uniref:S8 family serine peptidase n=1 Tax=Mesorhizobium sp. TaxID=1871066 RepID=UPI0035614558
MSVKDLALAKLSAIKPLEGVFPTASGQTGAVREQWRGVARSMRARDMTVAEVDSRAALGSELSAADVVESAVPTLSGSIETDEQLAGFAEAGIGFFHGSDSYSQMPLAQRRDAGGNGSVSRVMLEGSRILLEPERLILRFEAGVKAPERKRIFKRYGLLLVGSDGLPPDTYRLANTQGFATEVAAELMQEGVVVFAEPDFIEHIGTRYVPGDPSYPQQWHHPRIGCPNAWDVTKGEGVRIAIIDNGFDKGHPDLAFGTLSGWYRQTADFADADFTRGTASMPDQNHGTACAGMIAAKEGNGIGGCGVAFGSELNMIACMGDQVGTQSTLARAIAYAAQPSLEPGGVAGQLGADVISCSLGPNTALWTLRQVLSDAIDFAATQGRQGKGVAIFWACTNGNFPISSDQVCSHPSVCAVGRSTSADSDNGSGFGPELEFLAPGVQVLIPASGGGYAATTGTSFAAPCATGVAALALSQNLALTSTQLRDLIRSTCDKIGPLNYVNGRNPRFGYGRVNAEKAVAAAPAIV